MTLPIKSFPGNSLIGRRSDQRSTKSTNPQEFLIQWIHAAQKSSSIFVLFVVWIHRIRKSQGFFDLVDLWSDLYQSKNSLGFFGLVESLLQSWQRYRSNLWCFTKHTLTIQNFPGNCPTGRGQIRGPPNQTIHGNFSFGRLTPHTKKA